MFVDAGATFSPCKQYRYKLWRQWDASLPCILFIMLNPSTATERQNDPTVERCQRRAEQMGFGTLGVCNLFAWRSTDPSVLPEVPDPIGPDNDRAILEASSRAGMVVCGWGRDGALAGRGMAVRAMLQDAGVKLHALALTKDGNPGHPLYLSYSLKPFLWKSLTGDRNAPS